MKYPVYSGTHGFYSCVYPEMSLGFQALRSAISRESGVSIPDPADPENDDITFHCTVMYSERALSTPLSVAHDTCNRYRLSPLTALVKGLDYWEGHDNKGYLVLQVESAELRRLHDMWKLMGAEPSFATYDPHITLLTGDSAKVLQDESLRKRINTHLLVQPTLPKTLVLSNLSIYDLK